MQTPFLSVVPQRHTNDCAVACLAMVLGVSYETALVAFSHNVMGQGATIRQMQAATKLLKHRLRWSRQLGDLETETGILCVKSPRWKTDHLVILKDGLIIDTDATIWDRDVFMAAYEATPVSIMTVEPL